MRITILQRDIEWATPEVNRQRADEAIERNPHSDLYLLPEMFSTGFCTCPEGIAESVDSPTLQWMKAKAVQTDAAIAGSVAVKDGEKYYNRFYFVKPDGSVTYYDKKHLFTYGGEHLRFTAGEERVVEEFRGVRFLLEVCYDLRFPVWCRNVQQGYDLLICAANWPECRIKSWNNMLEARATENQAYACGVNRVGDDGLDLHYNGASAVYSAIGEELGRCRDNQEEVLTLDLDLDRLRHQREKFPSWKDADIFEITGGPACAEI